jgi:putative ABC transport system permease protein
MAEAAIAAIHAVDANRPVTRVVEMAQLIESGMAQRRFVARAFALFGLIALVLATTGLYSVLTVGVAERQREIGLRIALGAPVRSLAGLVLARGMLAACIGMALGLVAANSTRPLIQSLLYDPSTDFGLVSAAVATVLLGVMGLACLAPLVRAVRIDPAAALRGD